MGWSVETDEEAANRKGAIDGRYQICHPDEGLVEYADRRADAFSLAEWYAVQKNKYTGQPMFSDPYAFEVYDRMARVGAPQTWRLTADGWKVVGYKKS